MILTYKTYVNTKRKLLQINDSKSEIDKMDKELKDLAAENKNLVMQLQMCQMVR